MATIEDVEKLFNELDKERCCAIECLFGDSIYYFKKELLRRMDLITVNHITFLENMAIKFKIQHLVSHVYDSELIGHKGTNADEYTEEEISKLSKITLEDVQEIARDIYNELNELEEQCDELWSEWLDDDFFEENPDYDPFEFNQMLFEYYMDDIHNSFKYDEESGVVLTFNFEDYTIFDYLCYRRANQEESNIPVIYQNYIEYIDNSNKENFFEDYDKKISESNHFFSEMLMISSMNIDDESFSKLARKDIESLNKCSIQAGIEAPYEFYLNKKSLWGSIKK